MLMTQTNICPDVRLCKKFNLCLSHSYHGLHAWNFVVVAVVAGVQLSHKNAGILSTVFDIGGVIGGVLAGVTSDIIEARGVTSIVFLLLSIPSLLFYRVYGSVSMFTNIALMLISGALVNGPYSLITTAVSADLGTQSLIKGNSRALATVSAIIDGTGSVGAALGPLLAGYISTRGWNSVFVMLVLSIFIASLFLIPIVKNEIKGKLNEGKWLWISAFKRWFRTSRRQSYEYPFLKMKMVLDLNLWSSAEAPILLYRYLKISIEEFNSRLAKLLFLYVLFWISHFYRYTFHRTVNTCYITLYYSTDKSIILVPFRVSCSMRWMCCCSVETY